MNLKTGTARIAESLRFARAHESLWVLCVAGFFNSCSTGLMNPVLALYAREQGVTTAYIGLFMTSFAVGRILVTIPTGRMADRRGGRDLMVVGALLELTGAVWLVLASAFPALVAARLLQGVGSGLFMSSALILVADLCSPQDRGRVTSLYQGAILLGLTVSPWFGGVLGSAFDLRTPIIACAALLGVTALLVLLRVPARHTAAMSPVSVDAESAYELDTSASGGGSVIRAMVTSPSFVLIALSAFLLFVSRSGSRDTLLPLYGSSEFGLDAAALGVLFTLISFCNLLVIPVAGVAADTMGRKPPILLGLVLNGGALLLLGLSTIYPLFVIGVLMLGVAKGFTEPTMMIYVTDLSASGRRGAIFGTFLTLRDLGLFVGPVVLSAIAEAAGLRLPYILNGLAFVVVTALFALRARETRRVAQRGHV